MESESRFDGQGWKPEQYAARKRLLKQDRAKDDVLKEIIWRMIALIYEITKLCVREGAILSTVHLVKGTLTFFKACQLLPGFTDLPSLAFPFPLSNPFPIIFGFDLPLITEVAPLGEDIGF